MDENIRNLLSDEIASEIGGLVSVEQGTNEHAAAVDDLCKLCKTLLDAEKSDSETCAKEREERFNQEQMSENRISRYLSMGVELAGIILPLMFYGVWMRKGFKFEETGAFTSTTFRNLFTRFRPTGK